MNAAVVNETSKHIAAEMKKIGLALPKMPAGSGIPRFRISLAQINYEHLIAQALHFMLVEEDPLNTLSFVGLSD